MNWLNRPKAEKAAMNRFTPILIIFLVVFGTTSLVPGTAFSAQQDNKKAVSMDFDQIDIRVFIKFISELTGKNFVIDDKVRGKVTVLSPTPISVDEAYKVFESVLEVNGFTTVPSGDVTKVVPSVEARQKSVMTTKQVGGALDRFVTQIIPLEHASSNEVRKILAPLVSKQGILVAYEPSETLILTDYQSNIQRMLEIINAIDLESFDAELKVFYLEYGAAEKIVGQITQLMQYKRAQEKTQANSVAVADDRMNAIIVLAPTPEMKQISKLIERLDRPTPSGKGKVQVVRLENALAEELAEVLNGLVGRPAGEGQTEVISKNVSIVADKSTNSIVITSDPEEFAILADIIRELDAPREQVYIEAAIMEVSDSKILSLGVNWNIADTREGFLGLDEDTVGFAGSNPGGFPNLFVGDTLVPPSGLSLGLISFPFEFDGQEIFNLASLVNLAKSDTDINVLSYPQVMTMDNEEAKIIVADNIPFTTKTDTGTEVDSRVIQSIEYRDVGVTLKVTPHINTKGSVKLQIFQEVSRIVNQVVADESNNIVAIAPTTKKRTAETTVEVINGATIVIAGLLENEKENTNQGVPGLSDVPLLGWLFKSKVKQDSRTNLLIFITPRIILNPNDAKRIYHAKSKYMEKIRYGVDGRAGALNKPFQLHGPMRAQ